MRFGLGLMLTLLWILLVPAAQAQGDVLASRLDHSTLTAVVVLLDSASVAGLPTEPLTAKALEGAAKHAPGDRIVRAIRSLVTDLGRAREAFGGTATPSEIAAGATALRAGVDASALKQLRGMRSDLTMPLGILTDLVINGVPLDTAVTVIRTLAAQGAADADLAGLVRQVREDVSAGLPAGAAAMMRAGGPYGAPPPHVPGRPARATGVSGEARP